MWRTLLRDALSPLVGLGIILHEVLVASEPRFVALVAAFVLLGYPIDAAIRAASGWRGLPPSEPPPTIPSKPSAPSSGPSHGGSSSSGVERSVDAAADA